MKISHIPKACGVYQITSPSGKYYIGRSENMYRRMLNHVSDARQGKHFNLKLQRSFDKYGRKMKCEVLGLSDKDNVAYLETYFINLFFKDGKCMNAAIDPIGCDRHKNRDGYTKAYCVSYWTRQIYSVRSMQSWAKELGKDLTWRGAARRPNGESKFAVFQTRDECQNWLKVVDSLALNKIQAQLFSPEKEPPVIDLDVVNRHKKMNVYKWGYHIKCPNGRVTLARNSYEVKQYRAIDGYQRRRFNKPWPKVKHTTPGKQVVGVNQAGEQKIWPSIGSCAREIKKTHMTILAHCREERHKTENGWKLSFYGT